MLRKSNIKIKFPSWASHFHKGQLKKKSFKFVYPIDLQSKRSYTTTIKLHLSLKKSLTLQKFILTKKRFY